MANYIDNFSIDHSKIIHKIDDWKAKLKVKIDSKTSPKYKLIKKILWSVTGVIFGLFFLFLILFFSINMGETFFILMIVSFIAAIISGIILFIKIYKHRKMVSGIINDSIGDQNMFAIWFGEVFDNGEVSTKYQNMFATDYQDIKSIVEKYKYKTIGEKNIGVSSTYNIMGGKILNSPFNLSCGIYHSYTIRETKLNGETKRTREDYYEYMPIFQVKTNAFKDLDLWVTNSRVFDGYSKNKLKFDNITFGDKFYVKSNNDVESLMIFTALIQEKWVNSLKESPHFQMHVSNGMITILFKGSNSWSEQTTSPFMSITRAFDKSFDVDSFFSKINTIAINNFNIFLIMINYVFAISYFQWDDSTGDKQPIKESSQPENFIDNLKNNLVV